LREKLRAANELLGMSQKDYNELQKKYSTLMFELSWCKTQVKNAEKLKEVILYYYYYYYYYLLLIKSQYALNSKVKKMKTQVCWDVVLCQWASGSWCFR
jgi:hypothetical protein